MDDKEVGKYWDKNADNWTKLARLGYDRCRDLINSPAFFKEKSSHYYSTKN